MSGEDPWSKLRLSRYSWLCDRCEGVVTLLEGGHPPRVDGEGGCARLMEGVSRQVQAEEREEVHQEAGAVAIAPRSGPAEDVIEAREGVGDHVSPGHWERPFRDRSGFDEALDETSSCRDEDSKEPLGLSPPVWQAQAEE